MLLDQCPTGEGVSSLAWNSVGNYLAAALTPSAELAFFKLDDENLYYF